MVKVLQTHMLNLKRLDVSSTINKFINMQNIWLEKGMYVRRPPCEKLILILGSFLSSLCILFW